MNIVKYVHHGREVSVREDLKGQHRLHCLCFQNCKRFKPETEDNCVIARDIFENCVKHGVTTPVWECPHYESV